MTLEDLREPELGVLYARDFCDEMNAFLVSTFDREERPAAIESEGVEDVSLAL